MLTAVGVHGSDNFLMALRSHHRWMEMPTVASLAGGSFHSTFHGVGRHHRGRKIALDRTVAEAIFIPPQPAVKMEGTAAGAPAAKESAVRASPQGATVGGAFRCPGSPGSSGARHQARAGLRWRPPGGRLPPPRPLFMPRWCPSGACGTGLKIAPGNGRSVPPRRWGGHVHAPVVVRRTMSNC